MSRLTTSPMRSLLSVNCPAHCPEGPRFVPLSNLGHRWSDPRPDNPLTSQKTSSHALQKLDLDPGHQVHESRPCKDKSAQGWSPPGTFNAHRDKAGEMREPRSSWKTEQLCLLSGARVSRFWFIAAKWFSDKDKCRMSLTGTLHQEVSRLRT